MYTIGEFAALGHVSVRMLRHYDQIGLLRPATVNEYSGYRQYELAQLGDLLHIVELRDLGCSLDDAAAVLAADDRPSEMHAVLTRRRGEIATTIEAEAARLSRLERRLSLLEGETIMTDITYRTIAPVTVYSASDIVAPGQEPSSVIDRLLPALQGALDAAKVDYREPGVFWYEAVEATEELRVHVSWVAGDNARPGPGYALVELPEIERAAVTVYRGDMAGIGAAWNEFTQGVLDGGSTPLGSCREIYLETEPLPQSQWVTKLVQPVC